MIYLNDSSRVWHVSKAGSDANNGHAGQYPVNLGNDAKLTIGAAVSAVSSGDTIIIWPGDYAENVSAGSKALTFIGTHRNKSKIIPAAGDALSLANDCVVRNLAVEALATNAKGISFLAKENIVIEDCDIYGAYDGLYANSAKHVFLRNSRVRGKYDGWNAGSAEGIVAENCIFQGLGTYATSSPCRAVYGIGRGSFLNCVFLAKRNDVSDQFLLAVYLSNNARAVFTNCVFDVSAGSNHTGPVGGIYSYGTNAAAVLKNCSVYSASSGSPSFGPFDLWQVNGKIVVSGCSYETVSGTITQGGDGWSEGIKGELTEIGLDKAAKMLVNKAVQDKLSGAIEYYDDDGETVILTHTPAEGESSITRTPS